MIFIDVLFWLIFPIIIVPFIRKKKDVSDSLVSVNESNIIKGIAAIMVMAAHFQIFLTDYTNYSTSIIRPFSVLGGIGVLLFFFLSGYGIFKAYATKLPNWLFLKKRILKVYVASVVIKITLVIVNVIFLGNSMVALDYFMYIIIGDWFIDVIMIQYFIFYFAWRIACRRSEKEWLIPLTFAMSILVAVLFVKAGMEARWYNGLLLFPIGMLFAKYERRIENRIDSHWLINIGCQIFVFCILGGLFVCFKGNIWADCMKTLAGVFLALLFCSFFRKYEIKSPVLVRMGEISLYVYVIHLNILNIFETKMMWNGLEEIYFTIVVSCGLAILFKYVLDKCWTWLKI